MEQENAGNAQPQQSRVTTNHNYNYAEEYVDSRATNTNNNTNNNTIRQTTTQTNDTNIRQQTQSNLHQLTLPKDTQLDQTNPLNSLGHISTEMKMNISLKDIEDANRKSQVVLEEQLKKNKLRDQHSKKPGVQYSSVELAQKYPQVNTQLHVPGPPKLYPNALTANTRYLTLGVSVPCNLEPAHLATLYQIHVFKKLNVSKDFFQNGPHPLLAYIRRYFTRLIYRNALSGTTASLRIYDVGCNVSSIIHDDIYFAGGIYGNTGTADSYRHAKTDMELYKHTTKAWMFTTGLATANTIPHTLDRTPDGIIIPGVYNEDRTGLLENARIQPHIGVSIDTIYYPGVAEHLVMCLRKKIYMAVYGAFWVYPEEDSSGVYFNTEGIWEVRNKQVKSIPTGNQYAYIHPNKYSKLLECNAWMYYFTEGAHEYSYIINVTDRIISGGAHYLHFNITSTDHPLKIDEVVSTDIRVTTVYGPGKSWEAGPLAIKYDNADTLYHIENQQLYTLTDYSRDEGRPDSYTYKVSTMKVILPQEAFCKLLSTINISIKSTMSESEVADKITHLAIPFIAANTIYSLTEAQHILLSVLKYWRISKHNVRMSLEVDKVDAYEHANRQIISDRLSQKIIILLGILLLVFGAATIHYFIDGFLGKMCMFSTILYLMHVLPTHSEAAMAITIYMDKFICPRTRNAILFFSSFYGLYFTYHAFVPMAYTIIMMITEKEKYNTIKDFLIKYQRPLLTLVFAYFAYPYFLELAAWVGPHFKRNLVAQPDQHEVNKFFIFVGLSFIFLYGWYATLTLLLIPFVVLTMYLTTSFLYGFLQYIERGTIISAYSTSTLYTTPWAFLITAYIMLRLTRVVISKKAIIISRVGKNYYKSCIGPKYFNTNYFKLDPTNQVQLKKGYSQYRPLLSYNETITTAIEQFNTTPFCDTMQKISCTEVLPPIVMDTPVDYIEYHNCPCTVLSAAKRQAKYCVQPEHKTYMRFVTWFQLYMQPKLDEMFQTYNTHYNYSNWYNHLSQIQRQRIAQFYQDNQFLDEAAIREKTRIYTAFAKSEQQFEGMDSKTRCIVNPSELRKDITGPVIYDLERMMKLHFPEYMSGKNYTSRGYTLTAIAEKLGYDCVKIDTDGKDYDITQHIWLKYCDDMLYRTYFRYAPNIIPDRELVLEILLDHIAQIKVTDPTRHGRDMLIIHHEGRVHSGDMETTLGNSFRMMCYMHFVCYEAHIDTIYYALQVAGDDNALYINHVYYIIHKKQILRGYAAVFTTKDYTGRYHGLGQIAKYLKIGNIEQGDFCTTNCIPTTRQGKLFYRLIRVPLRAYRNMWAMGPSVLTPQQWIKATAECGLAWAEGIPIFEKLYKHILKLNGETPLYKGKKPKVKFPDKDDAIPFPITYSQHVDIPEHTQYQANILDKKQRYKTFERYVVNQPQDYENAITWLENNYGITRAEVLDTEKAIEHLTLDDQTWDLPVFKKFEKGILQDDLVSML
jgi:hypothetical protein